ncbi:MAG: hypothetical protein ACTSRA_22720 [Promethearchaeota archaeon]
MNYYLNFRNIKEKDKKLFTYIPHGSGIDGNWEITDKGKYFKCENSFHCMDEYGFYEGYADFSLIIPKKKPLDFRLHFHGKYSQYLNYKYGLRNYLEELFHWWIEESF